MKLKRPESEVLREVQRLLSARGILHFRRNVGRIRNANGQSVGFGEPGEADIEAHIRFPLSGSGYAHFIVWIECKGSEGKQSAKQRVFQRAVEAYGETYLLVRSATEVQEWLQANGLV